MGLITSIYLYVQFDYIYPSIIKLKIGLKKMVAQLLRKVIDRLLIVDYLKDILIRLHSLLIIIS